MCLDCLLHCNESGHSLLLGLTPGLFNCLVQQLVKHWTNQFLNIHHLSIGRKGWMEGVKGKSRRKGGREWGEGLSGLNVLCIVVVRILITLVSNQLLLRIVCTYRCTFKYCGIVVLCYGSSKWGFAWCWRTQNTHFAGNTRVWGQQKWWWVAHELSQSISWRQAIQLVQKRETWRGLWTCTHMYIIIMSTVQ